MNDIYRWEWRLTLLSYYNLTRVGFYLACILFLPYLILKCEVVPEKFVLYGFYVLMFIFGTFKVLPTLKRILYALNINNQTKDFLNVNLDRVVLPLNYLRPYNITVNDEYLTIPLDSISKVAYMNHVAKGQERDVSIKFTILNKPERNLILYDSEFINGQEGIDSFFEFFVDKVSTERLEFFK